MCIVYLMRVWGQGRPVSRDTNMTRKSANVGGKIKRQK